jgi:acylphosphatase
MSDLIRRIMIRGRVQGIGYRAWLAEAADASDLAGWVRNRRDGSVEAVLAGPAEAMAEIIAACRRGPSAARVEAIEDHAAAPDELKLRYPGESFSVLPTL